MESKELLKDKKTYRKILFFTNLTGAYNFYLDNDKKAVKMMTILVVSLLLTLVYGIGVIGILNNLFIWIIDVLKSNKAIENYNENIESLILNKDYYKILDLKSRNSKQYRKIVYLFGIVGLEDLYLEKYSVKSLRFIINGLYISFFALTIECLSIGFLYVAITQPEEAQQGAMWFVVFMMWGLMIPFLPVIIAGGYLMPVLIPIMIIITLYNIRFKIRNNIELVECHNKNKIRIYNYEMYDSFYTKKDNN